MHMTKGLYEISNSKGMKAKVILDDKLGSRIKGARRIGDPPPHFGGVVGSARRIVSRIAGKFRRAASYVAAEASLAVDGSLPPEQVADRLEACRGCEHRQVVEGKGEFCGRCGCGQRSRAELTIKSRMPAATCPIGRWPK